MTMKRPPGYFNAANDAANRGFTLVEILAVLAIFVLLIAAVLPSVSALRSARLGAAAQSIMDEVNLCRSSAVAENKPVELCFLRKATAENAGFDRVQVRSLEQDGSRRWMTPSLRLPDGLLISGDGTLSNLIGLQTVATNSDGDEEIAVRFYPSGEMSPVSPSPELNVVQTRYFTLAFATDLKRAPDTLPRNFATIQIDPRNSQATLHRP